MQRNQILQGNQDFQEPTSVLHRVRSAYCYQLVVIGIGICFY